MNVKVNVDEGWWKAGGVRYFNPEFGFRNAESGKEFGLNKGGGWVWTKGLRP